MAVAPSGLHHVTAIASDPQRNVDFYLRVLGLRLVKRTVNFDAPDTYHLYYGDEVGSPGTILTFFPWPGARRGRRGTGQATTVSFSVPEGSLGWWRERVAGAGVEGGRGLTPRRGRAHPRRPRRAGGAQWRRPAAALGGRAGAGRARDPRALRGHPQRGWRGHDRGAADRLPGGSAW